MDKSLILNEIKKHLNIKTDKAFSEFLGINKSTLSMWRERNTFDIELLFSKCEQIDANFLLTGKGKLLRNTEFDLLKDEKKDSSSEDFYKRLKEVFDFQNIDNPTKLQKKYGFNNTTATNYMEKGRIPKTEYLLTIKQKFEELDLNWLFTGKGEMLVNKSIEPLTSDEKIKFLEEKMLLMEENSNLLKENADLKIANMKLQAENTELKKVQSNISGKQTA